MNPDALDRYITGNYGADQEEKEGDRLYDAAYDAVYAYIDFFTATTADDVFGRTNIVLEQMVDLS